MKTNFKNLLLITAIVAVVLVASCKTKEKVNTPTLPDKEAVKVTLPCTGKDYQSDENFFRASSQGKSMDPTEAQNKAILNANSIITNDIKSMLKSVMKIYANSKTIQDKEKFESNYERYVVNVAEEYLVGTKDLCNDAYVKKNADGTSTYTYYIAREMPVNSVYKGASSNFKTSEELKLQYDEQEFKKIFDDQIKEYEKKKE